MIYFDFMLINTEGKLLNKDIKAYKNKFSEMLDVTGDFKIYIADKLFFYEPYFPVLEFLLSTQKWTKDKRNKNMYYCSVETEVKPLISFIYTNGLWSIQSPWSLFESNKLIEKSSIIKALTDLTTLVEKQLQSG